MTPSNFILSILIPAIIGMLGAYMTIKLLPYDVDAKKSQTIKNLFDAIERLEASRISDHKIIEEQAARIHTLENRKAVTLKAELHIKLTDPPIIDRSTVEYVVNEQLFDQ